MRTTIAALDMYCQVIFLFRNILRRTKGQVTADNLDSLRYDTLYTVHYIFTNMTPHHT